MLSELQEGLQITGLAMVNLREQPGIQVQSAQIYFCLSPFSQSISRCLEFDVEVGYK